MYKFSLDWFLKSNLKSDLIQQKNLVFQFFDPFNFLFIRFLIFWIVLFFHVGLDQFIKTLNTKDTSHLLSFILNSS